MSEPNVLEKELVYFRHHLPDWLGTQWCRRGQFVAIASDDLSSSAFLLGFFESERLALEYGWRRLGGDKPFLVRKIQPEPEPVFVTGLSEVKK